jgi:type VI secretion system protein VasD
MPFLISCLALLACTACSAKRINTCEKPPPFHLRLDADKGINWDDQGRSMPTVVQILQLKDSLNMEQAGFRTLWGKPDGKLQEDILEVSEFTVAPGQSVERWIQRAPNARYIMAMGLFRRPLGDAWRTFTVLPAVPEHMCVEQPAGEHRAPGPLDEKVRFKLQGFQIDLLRGAPSPAEPQPLQQSEHSTPPHGRKS